MNYADFEGMSEQKLKPAGSRFVCQQLIRGIHCVKTVCECQFGNQFWAATPDGVGDYV